MHQNWGLVCCLLFFPQSTWLHISARWQRRDTVLVGEEHRGDEGVFRYTLHGRDQPHRCSLVRRCLSHPVVITVTLVHRLHKRLVTLKRMLSRLVVNSLCQGLPPNLPEICGVADRFSVSGPSDIL